MKHGEHARFSAKWWKDSQPRGLASAHRFADALQDYETARQALETHPTPAAPKTALAALASVETTAKAVIAEAAKSKDPEMAATAEALRKLDLRGEREAIAARAQNGADEDDNSPFSAAGYPGYLLIALRRLRTTPMNFALVLGRAVDEHRLGLHRITSPMTLGHRLVAETGLHLMTFGTAVASDDRARTILLTVEGRQLPAIKKKTERMLRLHRPLPFQYVALFAGGAEVEDIDDADDHDIDLPFDEDPAGVHEADLRAEILHIRPLLNAAMLESAEKRTVIMSEVQRFVSRLKAGDLVGARAGIVALHALIPGEGFSPVKAEPPDPAI
jgi:hypothetical protein